MKVYTGTGDSGKTSLFSGERVEKSDVRIEAFGDVDELNAVVGSLVAALPNHDDTHVLRSELAQVQSDLFQVGALLATMPDSPSAGHLSPMTTEHSRRLERWIDAMQEQLSVLNAFILPGGHPSAAWSHVARTVCRRTERRVVQLVASKGVIQNGAGKMLVYFNRLSDYFFVLARYCNHLAGVEDVVWSG